MTNQYPQYPGSNQYPQYQPPSPGEGLYNQPTNPSYQAPPPPPPPPNYMPQAMPYPAGYAPTGMAPATTLSKLAEASLGLAILGLCTGLAAIGAVICGHLALSEINKPYAQVRGRELALAGLIIGYIEIGLYIILIFMFAMSK